jgi:hypothetical protein
MEPTEPLVDNEDEVSEPVTDDEPEEDSEETSSKRKVGSADGGDDWIDAFEPEPEPEEPERVIKEADYIEW